MQPGTRLAAPSAMPVRAGAALRRRGEAQRLPDIRGHDGPVPRPDPAPDPGPRFGHHIADIGIYADGQPAATGRPKPVVHGPAPGRTAPCSPASFGDTSPEVDDRGKFTGRLIVTLNEAELKDPCVRECVRQHEQVHVERLTPIVEKIAACDRDAGDDPAKSGACNEMATRELFAERSPGECAAYRQSFTCLTLGLLDPASPCSREPSRSQVQKHRGYEGCELHNYCTSAGTPELGVPNA